MDELTRVAVESFEQNNCFETLDYLKLLSKKGYKLGDVIIVCKKRHNTDRVEFKWNGKTLRFERINFKDDFMKHVKNKKECLNCNNNCARNEIPFCDFLELCRTGKFELVQIRLAS